MAGLPFSFLLFLSISKAECQSLNSEKKDFFSNLNIDAVVRIRNGSSNTIQGIKLGYAINVSQPSSIVYNCAIKQNEEILLQLKRVNDDNLLTFDCWISGLEGKDCDSLVQVTGASILLSSNSSQVESRKSTSVPESYMKAKNSQKNGMTFMVSAFTNDRGEPAAFLTSDDGQLWFQPVQGTEGSAKRTYGINEISKEPFRWSLRGNKAEGEEAREAHNKYVKLFLSKKPIALTEVPHLMGEELSENDCPQESESVITAFPNPFSSKVSINYTISEDSPTTLYIANSAGAKVVQLLSGAIQKKGLHKIEYNGSTLAAGTYYIKYTCGNINKIIKLVKQ